MAKRQKGNTEMSPEELAAMMAARAAEEEDKKENASENTGEASGGKPLEAPEDASAKEIGELKDRLIRQMAEFDNYRKRTEKEKAAMFDLGAKAIIEKILPTVDNFERGLKDAPEGAFAEGMEMVYKQLLKNLEEAGVCAIDCIDKEFDPNIHNAVMHEEDDSDKQNIVTEELQKGYMYKESLVRPSMVKVLN